MPRFPIKPLINLSKEQWKVLMERLMTKEGKLTTRAAGAITRFEPEAEREMGALYKDVSMGAGESSRQVERLPIAEARAKYFQNPEQYTTPTMGGPSAKVVSQPPGIEEAGVAGPEELASKISYERQKQVPLIKPPGRTARVMSKDIESQELEGAVKRLGVNPEDIRPGVSPKTIIAEKSRKPGDMITVPPAAELASDAMIADSMWKNMGGTKSLGAKVWDMFRSTQRKEEHIKTARDYFISSFVRWKQAPRKFSNTHPKEARVLGQLWQEFETSLQPQPTAIPGTNLPGKAGGGVAIGGVE
jgi:hypothetical protein